MGMFDSYLGQGDGYTRAQRTGLAQSAAVKRKREERAAEIERAKLRSAEKQERIKGQYGLTKQGMAETGATGRTGMEQTGATERQRLSDVAESRRQQAGFRAERATPTYKSKEADYQMKIYGSAVHGVASKHSKFNPETKGYDSPQWIKQIEAQYSPMALAGDTKGASERAIAEIETKGAYIDKWVTPKNKALIAEKLGWTDEQLAALDEKSPVVAGLYEKLLGEIRAAEEEKIYGDETLTSEGIPIVEEGAGGRLADIQKSVAQRQAEQKERTRQQQEAIRREEKRMYFGGM